MPDTSRHDAWQAGNSYDAYMGRWSRKLAPRFLDWIGPPQNLDWLEVGCGTGALSAAIVARCDPKSLIAIDPSQDFIATAQASVADPRARFQTGDAQALAFASASRDLIVSLLVLNFVPDRAKALAEMQRVTRPGGTIALCVWDYAGGGVEFMHAFWVAAAALDPAAGDLTEDKRFAFCTSEGLTDMARNAGLEHIECVPISVPTVFRDFDDYWRPFTLGAGPAPGYCASLAPEARQRLERQLRQDLPHREDGSIALEARAWALKGTVA
jgi:ubiquinone/menaquinone biosynthesis C-methylase UbiE